MGGVCGTYGGREKCVLGFGGGGTPKVRRPLGRLGLRWEDNIKMQLTKLEWSDVERLILT